jgi:putative ABC transport system permease protein
MPSLRRAVAEIDLEIAIGDVRPLDAVVDASFAARRYQVQLFVAFGLVALLIATLGVYALTSYSVSQRRREMNIRIALGARTREVIAMVIRQGVASIAFGVAAGTGAALGIGSVVASVLFDIRPRDPLVISAVAVIVMSTGTLACLVAARRGLVIDPASALREE